MKLSKLTSALALVLLAGAAQAQPISITLPDDAELTEPTRSRAEVLAELHLWRISGLEAFSRGEAGPPVFSDAYRKAQARYAWLRASPQYAELVAELTRRPGATVVARYAGPERQATGTR